METLHFWFVCFSIAIMFIGSIKYIMYFFGVNPVYDYFVTNGNTSRSTCFMFFLMYFIASLTVVIVELGFGGAVGSDGLEMWLFIFTIELLPVLVITCIIFPLWLLYKAIEKLNMLHERIISKRRGVS